MSTFEIVAVVVLGLLIALKGVAAIVAIDAGMHLWYRQECEQHGINPGPLPRRFRGFRRGGS